MTDQTNQDLPGQPTPRTVIQLEPELFQQVWDTNLKPVIEQMIKAERFDMAMGCLLAAQAMVQHPNIGSTVQIANFMGGLRERMLEKVLRNQEAIVSTAGFTPDVAKAMMEFVQAQGNPGGAVQ